ncbi:MAG: histidine phosphatase family protein [Marmoricola sp.]
MDTDDPSAEVWLVRHGETEWSRDHKHTGHTDIALTDNGVEVARRLHDRLAGAEFDLVLTSPMQRARRTAELAGFADAHVEQDLIEWDYGDYEGITTEEIREKVPDWTVWTHESPGGERAEQVAKRLDAVIGRARAHGGRVLCFGHGHSLRGLAARWIEQPVADGRFFNLDTATISVLAYERETPVVLRWNC